MTDTITMYDAIPEEMQNIPANPPAVAAYVDGFGGFSQLASRFPNAKRLSITIHGNHARCGDFESGAMSPPQAPGWYRTNADRSQGKPWLYASASNIAALIHEMTSAGISPSSYFIWSAHFTGRPHICGPHTCGFPQADGTQWDDVVGGRSCDVSDLSAYMLEPKAPPHPRAHGIARAELSFNLGKGHWNIHGTPGTDVHFGPDDTWASAELQVNERTGHWRIRGIPLDAGPLGK